MRENENNIFDRAGVTAPATRLFDNERYVSAIHCPVQRLARIELRHTPSGGVPWSGNDHAVVLTMALLGRADVPISPGWIERHWHRPHRLSSPATRSHPFLSGSENALRQTSLWMMLATLAPPDSGSFQVKASGIDPFFLAMKSFNASSMLGSRCGAS